MIDLQQYRMCVGCFYYKIPVCGTSRGKGYYILNHLLEIGIECSLAICLTLNILLLLCGDIEVNPGPKGMKICPQCKQYLSTRQNVCKCGHTFNKKGRPIGTTQATGYKVSKGRPIGKTCSTGCVIGSGRPVGTTVDAGLMLQVVDLLALLLMPVLMLLVDVLLVPTLVLGTMFQVAILLVQLSIMVQSHHLVRMILLNWQNMCNNMNYLLLGTQTNVIYL